MTLTALLPLPTGDPQLLLNLGKNLAYVASHGTDTVLARDAAGGLGLGGSWAGPAFAAASAEAQSGARLSHEVCDRVGPVVAAVNQYAGELTAARQTVEALREQWQAADRLLAETVHQPLPAAADPAAGLQMVQAANAHRERSRAELLTRHTACLQALEASEDRAAASVSAALGGAVSAGEQRQAILAQLPLTKESAHRAEVAALVDQACAGLGADPASWSPDDLVRVLGALAGSVEDPLVAQALMTRLGPSGVQHAARALGIQPGESGLPYEAASRDALRVLGLAFAVSVSDAAAADPVSDTVLDQWRPWLGPAPAGAAHLGDHRPARARGRGGHRPSSGPPRLPVCRGSRPHPHRALRSADRSLRAAADHSRGPARSHPRVCAGPVPAAVQHSRGRPPARPPRAAGPRHARPVGPARPGRRPRARGDRHPPAVDLVHGARRARRSAFESHRASHWPRSFSTPSVTPAWAGGRSRDKTRSTPTATWTRSVARRRPCSRLTRTGSGKPSSPSRPTLRRRRGCRGCSAR